MAEEATRASGKALAGSEKPKEERKAESGVAVVRKERVPESYISRIKVRPMRKIPPLRDGLFGENPRRRETITVGIARINYMVDMEQDCLRQHAAKGYAEIDVDTSSGVKRSFILPDQST